MRADLYLFTSNFTESRTKARAEIENGRLFVNGKCVTKPSFDITPDDDIELKGEFLHYVGRGGLKLDCAFKTFGSDNIYSEFLHKNGLAFSAENKICVDIGASTGGFTDCLLQNGARKVFAIDCGCGQLHPKLINNNKVVNIENFNARDLTKDTLSELCDIAVMDVSFISQILLFPAVTKVLKKDGMFLSLIKPQFEGGKAALNSKGIVKDKKIHMSVIKNVVNQAEIYGLKLLGIAKSSIKGGDGNTEYLALFIFSDNFISMELTSDFLKNLTDF